jgi:hypothetical protein
MIKRYGETNGAIFRNHGYCPYNQATKYKVSYEGEVYFIYVNNYLELKEALTELTGDYDEED